MNIFGDQSWRKIQRFLVQKEQESRRSKGIKKELQDACTIRSVKAIQSKIYQIKHEVDRTRELEHFETSLHERIANKIHSVEIEALSSDKVQATPQVEVLCPSFLSAASTPQKPKHLSLDVMESDALSRKHSDAMQNS